MRGGTRAQWREMVGKEKGCGEGRMDIRAYLILQRGVNLDSILVVYTDQRLSQ